MACKGSLEDFTVGQTRNIEVIVKDKRTNLPVDISGDKFYFTVKDTPDQPDAAAVIQTSVIAPADANSTNGIAIIPVSSADTAAVEPGNYYYDISWVRTVSAPGDVLPVEQGTIGFYYPVTRAAS